MRVLVYETNLMWSSRLVKSLQALGHQVEVRTAMPEGDLEADVAIVNLGSNAMPPRDLVGALRAQGIKTIGHAGHKEKDLLALGREAGCDRLATNSELTFKIEQILGELTEP